jgi:hypothetical protein
VLRSIQVTSAIRPTSSAIGNPEPRPHPVTTLLKISFLPPVSHLPLFNSRHCARHLPYSNRKYSVHGALRVEVMLNFRRPLKAMLGPLKGILTGEFRDRSL